MTMMTNQAAAKPMTSKRVVFQVAAALALSAYCLLHYAWLTESPPEQKWTDSASLIRGRSLSAVDLPPRCFIPREYRLSKQPTSPTYLASFHGGGGGKVISNLAQALTGIAATNQVNYARRRIDHSVLFETHYPLEGAIKVEGDDANFRGAILLLRNPVDSILSFFNAFYARKYHYLIDFRAPAEDWIRYRDSAQFADQLKAYERFVLHWMNKYKKNREDLVLITYEGITGGRGAIFTKQIASYLDKSEGINVIDPDSIPCIWEKFVRDQWYPNNGHASTATSFQERAEDRPLTQDQLFAVSRMLQSLDERFGRDKQFSTIMNSYMNSLYDYSDSVIS
uniref:Sulfotransferase domain-containing protein n=1 Tax=Skeletonema marinoi TaxID=267567 RepID=A0A7S2KZZ3_9STRA